MIGARTHYASGASPISVNLTRNLLRNWAIAQTDLGESLPPNPFLFVLKSKKAGFGRFSPKRVGAAAGSRSEVFTNVSTYERQPACQASQWLRLVVCLCLVFLTSTSAARSTPNHLKALVIGNGAYTYVGKLDNPASDVKDIARYLQNLKFDVTARLDMSREQTRQVIERFMNTLAPTDTALFYYSGHAVQINNQNYMLAADARLSSQQDLQKIGISLNDLIDRLEKRPGINLVFLDACRNNPFLKKIAVSYKARALSGKVSRLPVPPQQGLASIGSHSGNTLIVYAAAAGRLADDGTGQRNSPFTHSILKHISTPDLEVEVMLKRVTKEVRALTDYRQSPERLSRLSEEFYFNRPLKKRAALTTSPAFRPGNSVLKIQNRAPGQTFRSCQDCPEMIVLPIGAYQMGADSQDREATSREKPRHLVSISAPLAVGRSEVSFTQWEACVAQGACRHYQPRDNGWGRENHPVIYVSWRDATTYVDWLQKKTGKPYRLLSEAEWEYAARAPAPSASRLASLQPAGSGRAAKPDAQFINFDGSTTYKKGRAGLYRGKTVTIMQLKVNKFGLYNMRGNVSEWVQDCWFGSHQGAPTAGRAREKNNCQLRVVRGGSWYDEQSALRLSARKPHDANARLNIIGFRVALSLGRP